MKILNQLITLTLVITNLLYKTTCNKNSASIDIYSSYFKIDSFNVTIENFNLAVHTSVYLSGKICSFDLNKDIIADCFQKYENLNSKWLLLISSRSHLEYIDIELHDSKYEAVLFSTNSIHQEEILDRTHYFFQVSDSQLESLKQYDINSEKENTFAYIRYDPPVDGLIGKTWIIVLSLVLLILVAVHLICWIWYTYYFNRINYTLLQRYYAALPYMNLLLVGGVYYYVVNKVKDELDPNNLFFLLMTEIFIKLIRIIFKTFFWILVILVSHVSINFSFFIFR